MSKSRLSPKEKAGRKEAKSKMELAIKEINKILDQLPVAGQGPMVYGQAVTIEFLGRLIADKLQLSVSSAKGMVSFYVSTRSDLMINKGRNGGVRKLPDPLPKQDND